MCRPATPITCEGQGSTRLDLTPKRSGFDRLANFVWFSGAQTLTNVKALFAERAKRASPRYDTVLRGNQNSDGQKRIRDRIHEREAEGHPQQCPFKPVVRTRYEAWPTGRDSIVAAGLGPGLGIFPGHSLIRVHHWRSH